MVGHFFSLVLLECFCILSERIIEKGADEFSFVSVALFCRKICERLVFLGTDVGSSQFGSGLSLVRHTQEKQFIGTRMDAELPGVTKR